jgi:hypothetical protein
MQGFSAFSFFFGEAATNFFRNSQATHALQEIFGLTENVPNSSQSH